MFGDSEDSYQESNQNPDQERENDLIYWAVVGIPIAFIICMLFIYAGDASFYVFSAISFISFILWLTSLTMGQYEDWRKARVPLFSIFGITALLALIFSELDKFFSK